MKKYFSEMFGTFALVFFGCGIVSFFGTKCSPVIAALSFALVYVVGYCVLKKACPCYFNPVLPLADYLDKKITGKEFWLYILFQFLGAILGAFQLFIIIMLTTNVDALTVSYMGATGYGDLSKTNSSVWLAFIIEFVLTFAFVFVFLYFAQKKKSLKYIGYILAAAYFVVVVAGYYFTGGSANPARSYGPAIWVMLVGVTQAAEQSWLFILAPVAGSFIAFIVYKWAIGKTNPIKHFSKFRGAKVTRRAEIETSQDNKEADEESEKNDVVPETIKSGAAVKSVKSDSNDKSDRTDNVDDTANAETSLTQKKIDTRARSSKTRIALAKAAAKAKDLANKENIVCSEDAAPKANKKVQPNKSAQTKKSKQTKAVAKHTDNKKYLFEGIGTAIVVFLACGIICFNAGKASLVSACVVALAVAFCYYFIASISGCHLNPAVSLAYRVRGYITTKQFWFYSLAQVLGALVGVLALFLVSLISFGWVEPSQYMYAANTFGQTSISHITLGGAVVVEFIITVIVVLTFLAAQSRFKKAAIGALVIGGSIALVYLLAIPLTGASANPARSIAPAIMMIFYGDFVPVIHLAAFVFSTMAGGAVAGYLWKFFQK